MLYSITPLIQYAPLYAFLPESAFFRQKEKKGPLSGIEPRTTDTRDARDATTAIGSVFFTAAALPHPASRLRGGVYNAYVASMWLLSECECLIEGGRVRVSL